MGNTRFAPVSSCTAAHKRKRACRLVIDGHRLGKDDVVLVCLSGDDGASVASVTDVLKTRMKQLRARPKLWKQAKQLKSRAADGTLTPLLARELVSDGTGNVRKVSGNNGNIEVYTVRVCLPQTGALAKVAMQRPCAQIVVGVLLGATRNAPCSPA